MQLRTKNGYRDLHCVACGMPSRCSLLKCQCKVVWHRCTVHRVDEGMDTGEILGQSRVPVFPDDNQTSLSQRVKITEHALYPKIVDHLVTMTQPEEN